MDCSRWSKLVKVVDDQDGCEWVNVPSGTGSLRQSLTKGRKMVLCVLEMRYIVPRIWVGPIHFSQTLWWQTESGIFKTRNT